MARRPASTPTEVRAANLTVEEMRKGIERLRRRISDLERFDVQIVHSYAGPEVDALEKSIEETLQRVFGFGTIEFNRYHAAASIEPTSIIWDGEPPIYDTRAKVTRGIASSLAILRQAVRGLEEEVEDSEEVIADTTPLAGVSSAVTQSRKVFVVHGHDEGAREMVAAFLTRIDLQPIILNEQANEGRTVIEKVEAYSDVGFAVVLLTPDDVGSIVNGTPQARARQNVLLELGYFLGRLGRKHVCVLQRGDLEIPSDWRGVVSESFDAAGGWKMILGRELKAANLDFSWDKALG